MHGPALVRILMSTDPRDSACVYNADVWPCLLLCSQEISCRRNFFMAVDFHFRWS
jgi:hypothetical protein